MLGSSSLGKPFFSPFIITMLHHYYDAASLVTFFFSLYLGLSHCATRGQNHLTSPHLLIPLD
jgi:hypothetical protein